jgi:hypothetical protein
LSIVACGGDSHSNDDAGTDASLDHASPIDAAADVVNDASTPPPDASDSSVVDAAPGSVAECQALANGFATRCAISPDRVCFWNAYAQLCATGHTQLLIDSMKCLDNTACRTFSDPNQGESCLQALHAQNDSAKAKAYDSAICTACGGQNCNVVNGTDELIPYLVDSDIDAFSTCAGAVCPSSSVLKSCGAPIPDVAPFAACAQ